MLRRGTTWEAVLDSERVPAGTPQVEHVFTGEPTLAEVEVKVREIISANPGREVTGIETSNAIRQRGLEQVDGLRVDVDQRYFGFDAVRVVFRERT